MLRRISANHDTFKPIDFRSGFNVVLADRADDAADTDTRNARGKTTLFLLLHYLLGGNLSSQLRPLAEDDWAFTLTLDLLGQEVTVTRLLASGSRLAIRYPAALAPAVDPYVREGSISVEDWKALLGLGLFRLEPTDEAASYGLSPRTLLLYVMRTEVTKDALRAFGNQPAWSVRQHVAFLLDLDWTFVQRLRRLNQDFERLTTVRQAASDGLVPSLQDESALLLRRQEAQGALAAMEARVSNFLVLPSPETELDRANLLTQRISALRDSAVVDRQMASLYEEALRDDTALESETADIASLYESLGRAFAAPATRRLDEVQAFHRRVMENRRSFLNDELDVIRQRSAQRDEELRRLGAERSALMRTLSAGGALEELLALQSQTATLRAELATIDASLEQNRDIAARLEQLRLERATERAAAAQSLATSRDKLDRVTSRFDAKLRELYGQGGVLAAEVDDDGYKFNIRVAGQASTGVRAMQLLCLDLTLLEEGTSTGHHPDFVAHDSVVYDGVDPRQTAAALRLVRKTVMATGGQYICTLNSNDVPAEIAGESWFADGVVRTVLDTDEGGLLGVAF
jgi:uncharacterized protein YydD (DUF2326 family)